MRDIHLHLVVVKHRPVQLSQGLPNAHTHRGRQVDGSHVLKVVHRNANDVRRRLVSHLWQSRVLGPWW